MLRDARHSKRNKCYSQTHINNAYNKKYVSMRRGK